MKTRLHSSLWLICFCGLIGLTSSSQADDSEDVTTTVTISDEVVEAEATVADDAVEQERTSHQESSEPIAWGEDVRGWWDLGAGGFSWQFTLASFLQEPVVPEQPIVPVDSLAYVPLSTQFGTPGDLDLLELSTPRRQLAETGGGAPDVILGVESTILNTTDANDLIANSQSSTDIVVHSRSPISNDPRIRGYRMAQIRSFADGAYWIPIRPDFDTPLSRIDSSVIRDVVVLKGPFSVRYGSGFTVIDIALQDTPRYDNGYEWGGRTALTYDTNGAQWNGRQAVWGGSGNYGYRVSYGHRTGADYQAGDGFDVAASYNSRDVDFAFGYDLNENSSLRIGYQRVDQTDVELPAQYFDIDNLAGDSFTVRYNSEYGSFYDLLTVDSWWNRTRFTGNGDNITKPGTVALFGANSFLADNGNKGEARSTGVRSALTWGEPDTGQFSVGGDYSFLDQTFYETADGTGPSGNDYLGRFGLPRSKISTPGLFADFSRPMLDFATLGGGARIDWSRVDAVDSGVFDTNTYFGGRDPEVDYTLLSGYVNSRVAITCEIDATVGFGYAERAPTPTDLYSRTFLEVLQPGAVGDFRGSFVGNNPVFLDEEKAKQFDVGVEFAYERFRGGMYGFYSWIEDFITYRGTFTNFDTVNTDATLVGGELTGEFVITDRFSAFGRLGYVEGVDLDLDEPLWAIPPLDSRLGLRFQTLPDALVPWGMEFSARVVDNQDRVAVLMFGASGDRELPTPGFTTYDMRGFVQLTETVKLLVGAENFGDKNYQEHLDVRRDLSKGNPLGVFRPGRNFYAGLESVY